MLVFFPVPVQSRETESHRTRRQQIFDLLWLLLFDSLTLFLPAETVLLLFVRFRLFYPGRGEKGTRGELLSRVITFSRVTVNRKMMSPLLPSASSDLPLQRISSSSRDYRISYEIVPLSIESDLPPLSATVPFILTSRPFPSSLLHYSPLFADCLRLVFCC